MFHQPYSYDSSDHATYRTYDAEKNVVYLCLVFCPFKADAHKSVESTGRSIDVTSMNRLANDQSNDHRDVTPVRSELLDLWSLRLCALFMIQDISTDISVVVID